MAGDALHRQADHAAALAAGDDVPIQQATFKSEGGAAALGVALEELHGGHLGQGVPGFLIADQGQAQLAAVVADVLQGPDYIQCHDQSALAVMNAGAVDAAVPPGEGTAGEGTHRVNGIHVAQQQNGRQCPGRGGGGQARSGPFGTELLRLHTKSPAVGVQMAGQPVNGFGIGAGGFHPNQRLP